MANLNLDIASYIVDQSEATALATDIFVDFSPESPDSCISLYETSPGAPHPFDDVSTRNIQIVARDKNPFTARAKAIAIMKLFRNSEEKLQLTVDRWILSNIRQTPYKLKVDSKNRVYYAFNMFVTTYTD